MDGTRNQVTLFLCGDVMLGRGVDQILPHPGDPLLKEGYLTDARSYVALAEATGGPIPRPVGFSWPWGDALRVLDDAAPDVRVINLETSITRSDDFAPGKAVNYRMSPANLPSLTVARPDVCVLANNHVLDFGYRGLDDTLDALRDAGLRTSGTGRSAAEAWRPAVVASGGRRVLVFSFGMASAGVPAQWAATDDRPGVAFLPDLPGAQAIDMVARRVWRVRRPGDIVVASIHWGSNWGYSVPRDQTRLAHELIDRGVDIVHGHSSHHPRPIEVYHGKLILYGCGDLINDYEGIRGYHEYRDDLRLLYLASLRAPTGELAGLRMSPMQARQMRLRHASLTDAHWLRDTLRRASRGYGVDIDVMPDGTLALCWP